MENQDLRGVLIQLQDRLSDDDRKRLHFFLGAVIPRGIGDDPTLGGTLSLIQCLFDQDKISERDISFLIHVFDEIQCSDAVKILIGYQKRIQPRWSNQSTQSSESTIPSWIDQVLSDRDEDDKNSTYTPLVRQSNIYSDKKKIINDESKNKSPVTITVHKEKPLFLRSIHVQSHNIPFRINKCFLSTILSFMIVTGILAIIVIVKINRTREPRDNLKMKGNDIIMEEEKKKNQTIQQSNDPASEKNEQLNNQSNKCKKAKNNLLNIEGEIFGDKDSDPIFDLGLPNFTSSHYLSGITVRENEHDLESYEFQYSSPYGDPTPKESDFLANKNAVMKKPFKLGKNERVHKVEGQILRNNTILRDGTILTMSVITGLLFTTTQGHVSPSYNGPLGESFSECYDGYTLGYVKGQPSQLRITQLQFVWYPIIDKK